MLEFHEKAHVPLDVMVHPESTKSDGAVIATLVTVPPPPPPELQALPVPWK